MIDIVIVNWNSGNFLTRCIHSLLNNDKANLIEKIFVVDNNSSDNSLDLIESDYKIKVIKNKTNRGFAKAANQGFKSVTSDYVLLLNPDAYVLEDTISDCYKFLASKQDVDVLGCRLINDEGVTTKSCSRFPSAMRIFNDASGLSKILPRLFKPATIMTDWQHDYSMNVNVVMGAFMFFSSSLFKKIGFFDEDFFVYYEEVDFMKRLANSNGVTFYNHKIVAVHSGEGTTKNVKAFRLYLNLKSRLIYANKHFKNGGYFFCNVCTFVIEPWCRICLAILQRDLKGIKEIMRAFVSLLKNDWSYNSSAKTDKFFVK